MPFQNLEIHIVPGETSPSVTLYYSDAATHDTALASLPKDVQARIYSGTSQAEKTQGMGYISFPLNGVSTQQTLEFIENQKPFLDALSENFKREIEVASKRYATGEFTDPEKAREAALKDPNLDAALNIISLQLDAPKNHNENVEVIRNSAEIAEIINGSSTEELEKMGFSKLGISIYDQVKQLDGNSNQLSAAEVASAHWAELKLLHEGKPVTVETLAPLASAVYTEVYSKITDVGSDDVCPPAQTPGNATKSNGKCL